MKDTSNPTITEKLKDAALDTKQAAEIAGEELGDYLSEGWDKIKDSAYSAKATLVTGYQHSLRAVRTKSAEWKEKADEGAADLVESVEKRAARAEEELERLRSAGEDNWEDTRHSFNAAWAELRDGVKRAKAELEG